MKKVDIITEILKKDIPKLFFEKRKNANCILDLEKALLSNEKECVLQSMDKAKDLFVQIFEKDFLNPSIKTGDTEEKFKLWLTERYSDFVSHFVSYLLHEDEDIQAKSLHHLMVLVASEGSKPLRVVEQGTWFFPKELFKKIIQALLSQDADQQALIEKFEVYISLDDIKLYVLKSLMNVFDQQVTDVFLLNCFALLNSLKYPKSFPTEEQSSNTHLSQEGLTKPFQLKEKLFNKLFSTVWLRFLKYKLPGPLLKKTLVIAHKRIVPHLQNPCLLTDFLTNSYNHGGLISLLALNSLFILMQKYNVEYPDFYTKLYSLFDENIINGKFSERFFHLTDMFLSSTHLPAYLIAAFAKKISRISLKSKSENILRIVLLICRLLVRHPTLSILIHRVEPAELPKDPFNFEAQDPSESNAMESSLWEIKSLQNHINPDVSRKCKLINHELKKSGYDLSAALDMSSNELYHKERKRKSDSVPLAVSKPSKHFKWSNFSKSCLSSNVVVLT